MPCRPGNVNGPQRRERIIGTYGKYVGRRRVALLLISFLAICLTACSDKSPRPRKPMPRKPHTSPAMGTGAHLETVRFSIQVGAFSTPFRAARYAETLRGKGLGAFYFVDRDGLSKVRFGNFQSGEAARRSAERWRDRGLISDFFIVRPGGEMAGVRSPDRRHRLREGIVRTAERFLGTRYRWGGTSAATGFDCSGLTMTVYRLNGLELPRNSRSQFRKGTPVSRGRLMRGDLVFFATSGGSRVSHVGIYAGGGRFLHAPGTGKRIRFAALSEPYFKARYKGGRRYF